MDVHNLEHDLLVAEDEKVFYIQLHSVERVWNKKESDQDAVVL